MSAGEHPMSPESNSASRLAFISLAVLVLGVVVFPVAIPLSIVALELSRKAKSLESIDDVARSVAKITHALSIALLVVGILAIVLFFGMNFGVRTTATHTITPGVTSVPIPVKP